MKEKKKKKKKSDMTEWLRKKKRYDVILWTKKDFDIWNISSVEQTGRTQRMKEIT